MSEEKIKQLRLFRETMPKPNTGAESALTDWFETQGVEFAVYAHKLVFE